MGKVMRIDLEDLRFYSYHGFYTDEQVLGNEYEVTIRTATSYSFFAKEEGGDPFENRVNYEQLYAIAKNSMNMPRKLLETVAEEMLDSIRQKFPALDSIEVSICKINPPFGGDSARARVSINWNIKE